MRRILTLFFFFIVAIISAQSGQVSDIGEVRTLADVFVKGRTTGHIRNHLMATYNSGPLKDYWSNAWGGALKFETGRFRGFSVGVKGIFTYNLGGSDLNETDPLTGKSAKWEKELYDFTRPREKRDLDRLEELYVRYGNRWLDLYVGKIDVNRGPLLLRRDGRMKPFVYRGVWTGVRWNPVWQMHIGWLDGVSPRGVTEWYSMDEALGLVNNGYLPSGEKADYREAAQTKGLGVWINEYRGLKNVKIAWSNYLFHHIMGTSWLQIDHDSGRFFAGLQYVYQWPMIRQKSLEVSHKYIQDGENGQGVGGRVGYAWGPWKTSLAYLHLFGTGRFLFPRELGREDFYVSQPRSWMDGFGDTDVAMVRVTYEDKKGWELDWRLSHTWTPSLDAFSLNKYGISSFYQSTFSAKYSFQGKWKGLEMTLLYIYKDLSDKQAVDLATKAYRYDVHHINWITNIHF